MILYHGSFVAVDQPDLTHRTEKALSYLSFEGSEKL